RNFGIASPMLWRFCFSTTVDVLGKWFLKNALSACGALIAGASGILAGIGMGTARLLMLGDDPVRRDPEADRLRSAPGHGPSPKESSPPRSVVEPAITKA